MMTKFMIFFPVVRTCMRVRDSSMKTDGRHDMSTACKKFEFNIKALDASRTFVDAPVGGTS